MSGPSAVLHQTVWRRVNGDVSAILRVTREKHRDALLHCHFQSLVVVQSFVVPASIPKALALYNKDLRRRRALLLGGDTAVLFLFAAIGRKNHGEGLQLAQTFNTALPFLVGVFPCHCMALACCFRIGPQKLSEDIPQLHNAKPALTCE